MSEKHHRLHRSFNLLKSDEKQRMRLGVLAVVNPQVSHGLAKDANDRLELISS
jgi:hypothetical protein